MTITRNETVQVLAMIAAFDQRTVGETDVTAWHTVGTESGWTFDLARRAVIEHHKHDTPRIKPGHVTDTIDAARNRIRAQAFRNALTPPKSLGDDPRAEIAWRRQFAAEFLDRAMQAWADGQAVPQLETP